MNFEKDQVINLTGKLMYILEQSFEVFVCKVKIGSSKNIPIKYSMIFNINSLIFSIQDQTNKNLLIVKHKFALRNIEVQVDRSDPRLMNLMAKDSKDEYVDICLFLEDVNDSISLKKKLEENRKLGRNTEYILLVKYFDDLLNNWNIDFNI